MLFTDYKWATDADLHTYAGKWVAIINKQVVASDKDLQKVVEESKKQYPKQKPLLTKINNKLSIF